MQTVRHLLAHRHLALIICAATLLLKLLVPTGYMIGADSGRITVSICSGTAPRTMMLEVPGLSGDTADHGAPSTGDGKADMPCAFAGLSAAAVHPIDPIQLAALIAFVMAIGLAVTRFPAPARRAYLRPPLRGPPAYR